MTTPAAEALNSEQRIPTEKDVDTVSRQLGRPARDIVEIGARCVCGNPLVATTAPRLSSGIPFPTTYYLTHPVATSACSRVEAEGLMVTMNEQLAEDPELAKAYAAAHEHYLAVRDAIGKRSGVGEVPEIAGVSAGGMPDRVKCIHVLVGHSLAAARERTRSVTKLSRRFPNGGAPTCARALARGTPKVQPHPRTNHATSGPRPATLNRSASNAPLNVPQRRRRATRCAPPSSTVEPTQSVC